MAGSSLSGMSYILPRTSLNAPPIENELFVFWSSDELPSPAYPPTNQSTSPCKRGAQIWDTAGQEKYHSLAPMYYRGAGAAIVVYDITKMHSFRTLKEWINELQAQGPQDIAIAIAGNKRDLEPQRVRGSSLCAC